MNEIYELPNGMWRVRNPKANIEYPDMDRRDAAECIKNANDWDMGVVQVRYLSGKVELL